MEKKASKETVEYIIYFFKFLKFFKIIIFLIQVLSTHQGWLDPIGSNPLNFFGKEKK